MIKTPISPPLSSLHSCSDINNLDSSSTVGHMPLTLCTLWLHGKHGAGGSGSGMSSAAGNHLPSTWREACMEHRHAIQGLVSSQENKHAIQAQQTMAFYDCGS